MSYQLIITFLIGAVAGSFLNVVAQRFVSGQKITGRSACPECQRTLSPFELIPVLSWLIQLGRCRTCHHPLSKRYLITELVAGLIFVLIFLQPHLAYFNAVILIIFSCLLLVLFLIDLDTMLLPDIFTGALLGLALIYLLLNSTNWQTSLVGSLIGSGTLLIIWLATRGRGIGLGDVKLMIPVGLVLGGSATALALWFAFVSGGFFALILLLTHRVGLKTAIPFGPFLISASLLLILLPQITSQLLHFVYGV